MRARQNGALVADPPFSADAEFEPYWWEAAPRPALPAAALLACAGRDVVVLEAGEAGKRTRSRNGGRCGELLKPGPGELIRGKVS